MTLIATKQPDIYLSPSERTDAIYTVHGVGTLDPRCNCPAGSHGKSCKHEIAALRLMPRLMKRRTDEMTTEEKTMAVTLAERSQTVIKAEEARLGAAAHLQAWNDLKALAAEHIKSGMAPTDVTRPEQGAMILLKALELSIPLTAAYEFVAVIHGRPKLMGQMVDALVSRSGKGYIHLAETSSQKCVAIGYREGRKPLQITFTIDDLRKMGAATKNATYDLYPADHLRWKAIARIGRVMFADVLGGMDVVGPDGAIVDSMDFSQEEGHETGRAEVVDGEFTPVPREESATKASTGPGDRDDTGKGVVSGVDGEGGPEPSPSQSPAPILAGDMEAEWGKLPKLLSSAGIMGAELTPILGAFTKPRFAEWLAAEPGRSAAVLVEMAVEAKADSPD